MGKDKAFKRITFLAEKFNVFDEDDFEEFSKDNEYFPVIYNPTNTIDNDEVIAYYKVKRYSDGAIKIDDNDNPIINWVGVREDIFTDMVLSDPTVNKVHVQWMLQTFSRYIKNHNIDKAIRFATEDLPQAGEYLELFEANKFKKDFKRMCKGNEAFKNINDPSNINQYKDLSQLFDAVDPYIERNTSELENAMKNAVRRGEGLIPYKDRKFTVFIPKTKNSATLFHKFTTWCTAVLSQTNFNYYVNQRTSKGEKSSLYVIIDNDFFYPESDPRHVSDGLWQMHVESSQLMDRKDRPPTNFNEKVLDKSEGLTEYLYDTILDFARHDNNGANSVYAKMLIKLGFTDILFEVMNPNREDINFRDMRIKKLPDMSKFVNLKSLFIYNSKLERLDESVSKLSQLMMLSIPKNNVTKIPKGICYLKKLAFINLAGNKITEVPNELKNLDRSNGGELVRIVIDKNLSDNVIQKIKDLLPTTEVALND